jgi:hypothetical protein
MCFKTLSVFFLSEMRPDIYIEQSKNVFANDLVFSPFSSILKSDIEIANF